MRKLTFLLTFLLFVAFQASAQMQITGKVTNAESGEPIPGASVVVKSQTTIGTTTDMDGNYTLDGVPSDAETLIFSFVGMQEKEVAINGRTTINVELAPAVTEMDEVVVVGYGSRSKKNLTSSVAKVDSEEMNKVTEMSIDDALSGQVSGLNVTQNSGAPGSGTSVRIRGATTVSGSNQPLYVIDGVPVVSETVTTDSYGGQQGSALSNINPNDIESVDVLKDAAAAAVYGARASNGVVLITTKTGKKGDFNVNLDMSYGVKSATDKYEVAPVGEYFKWADKAFSVTNPLSSLWSYSQGWVDNPNATPETSEDLNNLYNGNLDAFDREVTNYLEEVYRDNVPVSELSLSVRGGDEKTTYYLGLSNSKEEGTVVGQDYDRKGVRLNINQDASDWLELFAKVNYSKEEVNRINNDNNIYGVLSTGLLEAPGIPVYDENGDFTTDGFRYSNPVQMAHVVDGVTNNDRLNGSVGLEADIIEGLSFKTNLNLDKLSFRERRYIPKETSWGSVYEGKGFVASDVYDKWLTTNQLNYIKDVGELTINATGVLEFQQYTRTFNFSETNVFAVSDLRWPYSGSENASDNGNPASQTENRLFSLVGRVSLNYSNTYLLDLAMRSDASSKFGEEERTGYFPSASFGWKVHNESFFAVDAISELKPKISWGLTGNESGIGDFRARTLATGKPYAEAAGLHVNQLGDPELSWEKTTQINTGIDVGLFNDRVLFEYQYYKKKTTDLLLNRPIAGSTGFTGVLSNIGEMENIGHEFSLNATILDGEFSWTSTLNVATLQNEVTKLYQEQPIDAGFVSRVAVGEPLGAFYVFETTDNDGDGTILDENGDVEYNDRNGDGVINDDDKYFAGSPMPDISGNFRNTFSYKGFSLSANFNFKSGNDMYNNTRAFAGASGAAIFSKLEDEIDDYWTEENTNTNTPRPATGGAQANNNRDSDRFVEDASFIRLRNVTLSYTIPKDVLGNVEARIFVGGDNLLLWTDYSGLDPEINAFGAANVATGTEFLSQGLTRTLKIGANITF